jgi:hypothetical protein
VGHLFRLAGLRSDHEQVELAVLHSAAVDLADERLIGTGDPNPLVSAVGDALP